MKSISIVALSFGLTGFLYGQVDNGLCCDPQGTGYGGNVGLCTAQGEDPTQPPLSGPGNCDPNCGPIDGDDCTTIPLDGGLSLLALAGGRLATAAMRRRREEEEAAQHVA